MKLMKIWMVKVTKMCPANLKPQTTSVDLKCFPSFSETCFCCFTIFLLNMRLPLFNLFFSFFSSLFTSFSLHIKPMLFSYFLLVKL